MDLPEDFRKTLKNVTNKRAKFVIDTILKKGFCNTEDLKNAGYEHAPRAARDVRELGIPLETYKMKDSSGKSIAAYKFGNWETAKEKNQLAKTLGRTRLSEQLKKALIEKYGAKCNLYGEPYSVDLLQPDHRIPYEIGGNPLDMLDTDYFMLLSPSANRDKSWTCEHCINWAKKDIGMCKTCYYAYPEQYQHIAGEKERKLDIVFKNEEIELYEKIVEQAKFHHVSYQSEIKRMLEYSQLIKNNLKEEEYG